MAELNEHFYSSRGELAEALATGVAAVLGGAIAANGSATLAVSGGSTPKLFFQHLSKTQIDWAKVTIYLVDERIAPLDNERSNARLVRENLLQSAAANARLVPYVVDGATPEECAEKSAEMISVPGGQMDCVILGMGIDGHTASFFPEGNRLLGALDLETKADVLAMEAPGAGEPRLTMTLPFLMDARFIALHIEGEEKKSVLETALGGKNQLEMPVRAVLQQNVAPINIFWAP